ncbi:MAG: lipid biosynthesis B12-binding/radical SAM protein [Planctomycetota bacterium]
MRVLLISSNIATSPYPVYPLGTGTIAAALRHAGHETAMFDWLAAGESLEAWREALRYHRPGLVGVSIRNLDSVNLLNEKRYTAVVATLVRAVHEELGVPVVLGGSGYSLLPEIVLRESGADYGIVGEGERLIVDLVEAIAQGRRPVAGMILRNSAHLEGSALRGAYYDPDILGSCLSAGSIAPIQTKRGCNLRCAYCSYPALEGGTLRTRPARDVVDDIEKLRSEHKTSYIFFTDSVFNDDQGAYLEVLREMKRRRVSIPWSAFLKPTGITENVAALMRETGLVAAELGSDAATDATLWKLRKPFRFADVVSANDVLMKQGIAVAHYFMFGGPGETPDTVREGIQNIRSLCCTAVFVFLGIRILPHTELHQIALREEGVARDCDLLEPVYYLSPAIERAWAERTLTQTFDDLPHVVFPPDALDDKLQLLHKLGYAGSLWELLGGCPQNTPDSEGPDPRLVSTAGPRRDRKRRRGSR